jgi:di/tricarboxylate transporter
MSKERLGLALGIIALAAVIMMPPVPGLPGAGKMTLAVAVFAIIIWMTQAVEDALSGLIIVFLLAALNATNLAGALSGYSNSALWLIVIGFVMAAVMERSGLSKRIALYLVNLAGGSSGKIYWSIALVMAVLTFLVTISWGEWFRVGGPPAFVLGFLSVFLVRFLWPPEMATLGRGQDYVREELAKLGPVSRMELYTMVVFLLTLVLWATDGIHKVNVAIVGLFSIILLIWPGFGVMSWKEAQGKVPWNVFVLYGAGLSLGAALVSSGAAKWLAGTMLKPIVSFDHTLQVVILIWVATLLQVFFTGGGPKTTALTPIVIAHATAIGANPLVFALVLGMNMQHQYFLPVSNMPNAVIVGTGHLKAGELMRTGAWMSLMAAAFFSVVVYTYWKWIGIL